MKNVTNHVSDALNEGTNYDKNELIGKMRCFTLLNSSKTHVWFARHHA